MENGSPEWEKHEDLVSVFMTSSDAHVLLEYLSEMLRNVTRRSRISSKETLDLCRISRLMHELTSSNSLTGLSVEDLMILDDIPKRTETAFLTRPRECSMNIRRSGPVGPVEADRLAKDFVKIMTE